jgi:hypothetical protein
MEKKCKIEFRQARTDLQECNEFIVLAARWHPCLALTKLGVIQHGAAVLSSEAKVSGYGK